MRLSHWLWCLLWLSSTLLAAPTYELEFNLQFKPQDHQAFGEIRLGAGSDRVVQLDLAMDPGRYPEVELIEGQGSVKRDGKRVLWRPQGPSVLRYRVVIDQRRANGAYRARYTDQWAIFRADHVFPAASVTVRGGARSRSHVSFRGPKDWHFETPYPRAKDQRFRVDIPARGFDRPVGWMIAGRIHVRRDVYDGTGIYVVGPRDLELRRMEMLALIGHTIPHMRDAFGALPDKLLLVIGPEPMWRGGLSGPNSLFMHADRPLISTNATSTLLHELTHVITRIRGAKPSDDWLAEGLAEYYGLELVRRSGGITQDRFDAALKWQRNWGKSIKSLRVARSRGPTTARAVVLLAELDREMRSLTRGEVGLDDLVQRLRQQRSVSTEDFIKLAEALAEGPLEALDTPLLTAPKAKH
ncbi:MAG: hypothetical protein R3F15_09335 [Lysobacterales bacterium]